MMSNPTGVPTKVSVRASTTEWGVGVYRQNVAKRVVIKRVKSADYKRSMLLALRKGLALARDISKHEDTLTLEISNAYVFGWFDSGKAPELYSEDFNSVVALLQLVDSKVRIKYVTNPQISREKSGEKESKGISALDLVGAFE